MSLVTHRWSKSAVFLMALVLAALAFLYFPGVKSLLQDWKTNEHYSYGVFVPFISVCMSYSVRKELGRYPLDSSLWGILFLVSGLCLLVGAEIAGEFFLQQFSFIVVSLGVVLFLCGGWYFKKLALPVLYLVFMIPLPDNLWNKIAMPMQLFSAYLTEKVLSVIDLPVYRDGNLLYLAEAPLEVTAACSGLRYLVIMFALSSVFAFFSRLSAPGKWTLFSFALPIALFASITRLTIVAVITLRYGTDYAYGFLQDFSDIIVFALGLLLLATVNHLLEEQV